MMRDRTINTIEFVINCVVICGLVGWWTARTIADAASTRPSAGSFDTAAAALLTLAEGFGPAES